VVGLAWSNDPEIYAGGSLATDRAFHARLVKGDDPDKMGYPGQPGWGLGVRLTASPHKKYIRGLLEKYPTVFFYANT